MSEHRNYFLVLDIVLIPSITILLSLVFATIGFPQQPYRMEKEVSEFTQKYNLGSQLQSGEMLQDLQTTIDILARERARLFGRQVSEEDFRVVSFFLCIRLPNDPPKAPRTQQTAIRYRSRIIKGTYTSALKRDAIVKAIKPNILMSSRLDISSNQLAINELLDLSKIPD